MDMERYLLERRQIRLSEQQRQAVEAVSGDILLLAVPGAGKTTVIAARAANLLANHGADPRHILTLTYNKESARDMSRRWEALFGGLFPLAPRFSTIHSFCLGLLREYAAGRGAALPELLEGGEEGGGRARVLMALYRDITGQFMTDDLLNSAMNAMGYCVNMQLAGEAVQAFDEEIAGFSDLYARYTVYKRENRLMDFDDMLLFANTALERSQVLAARVRVRYDYVMVDEAQDTSKLQHSILQRVSRGNLFMVGDEDQSIYSFRGAYPQGLTQFFESYPDGRLMKLEENYRSTQAIVAGAARLIETNRQRYQKHIVTHREEGEPLRVLQDLGQEEEYGAIADLLERVPESETCAVLYRTGFTGIGLGWTLRRRGIPFFSRETRLGYGGDLITRDVSNLFRLAQNPGDAQVFRQIYFKLGCAIPRAAAEAALAARTGDLLGYIIDNVDYPTKNSGKLGWTRRVLAGMGKKSPRRQFDNIVGELEYFRVLEKKCQNGYQMNPYCQKLSIVRDFADEAPDTDSFLERLAEAEQVLQNPRRCHIVLSTVHSAKGQEFDRVIIADALEGIFPSVDALEHRAVGRLELLEEETRLFYTAMTRAKDRLVIFAPSQCLGRSLTPSRFLHAISGGVPTVGDMALVPGVRVMHGYFGIGVVEAVDSARGQVSVRFKIGGLKRFTMESLEDPKIFQLI